MAEERVRYSDAELQEFKKIIQDKIAKAEKDLALINESFINDQNNGTDDTSPTFKAFEEGRRSVICTIILVIDETFVNEG